jgi:glycosyltransferase involved in cell wall biosynthesis
VESKLLEIFELLALGNFKKSLETYFNDSVCLQYHKSNPKTGIHAYFDAFCFSGILERSNLRKYLKGKLLEDGSLKYKSLLKHLIDFENLEIDIRDVFETLENRETISKKFLCNELSVDDLPDSIREILLFQKQLDSSWLKVKENIGELAFYRSFPLIPCHYEKCNLKAYKFHFGALPAIWVRLSPLFFSWSSEYAIGKSCLWVFPSIAHFMQSLFSKEFSSLLASNRHQIFVCGIDGIKNFKGFVEFVNPSNQRVEKTFEQELKKGASETLYTLGKDVVTWHELLRLGDIKGLSIAYKRFFQDWRDPQIKKKGYFLFEELSKSVHSQEKIIKRKRRNIKQEKGIKIAHVVSMLREGSHHAPSRLLSSLVENHSSDCIPLVLSHESLCPHLGEYPRSNLITSSSKEEARSLIEKWKNQGIKTWINSSFNLFEESAKHLSMELERQNVDVAVFHEWLPINAMVARQTSVPLKVFFDHGTHHPISKAVDSVIVSNLESKNIFEKTCCSSENIAYLPYSIDCRQDWNLHICAKKQFGLLESDVLMTTISNHLESRLSDQMCSAIRSILKKSPNSYYLPIGYVKDPKALLKKIGMPGRVFLLGFIEQPSLLVRSMDLYLNEFPFGSGLSVLDAMASGCSVVTMYNEQGAPQGRFGGIYFGKEKSITSLNEKDYIDLACRLIRDKELRSLWKEETLQRFDQIVNPKRYAREFEDVIKGFIENSCFSNSLSEKVIGSFLTTS